MKLFATKRGPRQSFEVYATPQGDAFIRRIEANGNVTEWFAVNRTAEEWVKLNNVREQKFPWKFED